MKSASWLAKEAAAHLPAAYEALRASQAQALTPFPWPTRKVERWKYADLSLLKSQTWQAAQDADMSWVDAQLSQLKQSAQENAVMIVLVNGIWHPELSSSHPSNLKVNTLVTSMQDEKVSLHAFDATIYPFAALNQYYAEHGLCIHLMSGSEAVQVISLHTANAPAYVNQTLQIEVSDNARLHVFEQTISDGRSVMFVNQVVHLNLASAASCHWVKYQAFDKASVGLSHYEVNQAKGSDYTFVNLSDGAKLARDEVCIHLNEAGAQCQTAGLYYLTEDKQWIDNHVEVNHVAPHTQSDMLFKGILDKASQAVFNGRLCVKPGAEKIIAHQANHHLLLSNQAEAYAKPELEIYADDVKCKHGATTGQLDEDALFYLQSRGIAPKQAKEILMASFMQEVLAVIVDPVLREQMQSKMVTL